MTERKHALVQPYATVRAPRDQRPPVTGDPSLSDALARSWLTLHEAADVAERSPTTVKRWIREGRLRGIDLEGITWVNELALLHVERATRRAARAGRPGPRPPIERLADALGPPRTSTRVDGVTQGERSSNTLRNTCDPTEASRR